VSIAFVCGRVRIGVLVVVHSVYEHFVSCLHSGTTIRTRSESQRTLHAESCVTTRQKHTIHCAIKTNRAPTYLLGRLPCTYVNPNIHSPDECTVKHMVRERKRWNTWMHVPSPSTTGTTSQLLSPHPPPSTRQQAYSDSPHTHTRRHVLSITYLPIGAILCDLVCFEAHTITKLFTL
jgi:hypothetical protein